ncbi:MAG: (4Fe-4S)-binding protein, partial [Bacillota bacterium]
FVCINKYDLNSEITREIEEFCEDNDFPVIGRIPFEPAIVKALQQLKTPVEAGIQSVTKEVENIWRSLITQMGMPK